MNRVIACLTLLVSSLGAQAALLGRAPLTPGATDYQAYYDTVLNITWLADANLAATQKFGLPSSAFDYGATDQFTAREWIAAMNSAAYLGISSWRLPNTVDTDSPGCDEASGGTDCGYDVLKKSGAPDAFEPGQVVYSELAHLWQVTLGNLGPGPNCLEFEPYDPFCGYNGGPFSNAVTTLISISVDPYVATVSPLFLAGTDYGGTLPEDQRAPPQCDLSGTICLPPKDWGGPGHNYITYSAGSGQQLYWFGDYGPHGNIWAVTDGDIATVVPIPAAAWLLGAALGVLTVLRRRASA